MIGNHVPRHLDLLLEKLGKNYEVSRIKAIGGAAQVRHGVLTVLT